MAFSFGFYNSIDGDRVYDATQMSSLFDGIINDGVFMSYGDQMMVTPVSGLQVAVGAGRAWFNSTWNMNDSAAYLTLENPNVTLPRIDTIILEIDSSEFTRTNSLKILTGTAASSPTASTLTNTTYVHQYKLAEIYLNANTYTVTPSNITNYVGTSSTPFITGVLETMDIDALIAQWGSQWNDFVAASAESFQGQYDEWVEWVATNKESFLEQTTAIVSEMTLYQTTMEADFTEWLNNVKDIFDDEAIGTLQLSIEAEAQASFERYYSIANQVTNIVKDSSGKVSTITQTSTEAVATTTFDRGTDTTTITCVVVPEEGSYNYTNTTVIAKGDTTTITSSYVKSIKT